MKNAPTKLIVNLEEVYYGNKWHYSCVDYLLLSGREKLNRKESYVEDANDNDIFQIARDAIDHSIREMEMEKKENAKTHEELEEFIDEICGGLTVWQKEMVRYLVSKILNERNKGE